ncbi:MAG: response regulator [Treponema sp.]|jgi:PAS domain S-box-containing protein|nr:response regulator [Treponema sp.]
MTEEAAEILQKEKAALEIQVKKLNRQVSIQQQVMYRFEKLSTTRDQLSLMLKDAQSKQEKYMNMMLENSSNIIILLDGEGRFAYCTDTFLKIAGIQNFGLIDGQHFSEVFERFHDTVFSSHTQTYVREAMNTAETVRQEEIVDLRGSGDPRIYITHITAMRDKAGTVEGIMILFHDVTETTRARQAAEAASQAKSAFLATMSHEIRTPLNAIIGLSEIELQKELPHDTHEDLEKIYNSGSTLLGLINDILDISKIEAGNFELIPVDYDSPSLINDTVQLNIVRIGSKPITFKLLVDETLPARFHGDELRVKQILNNLLSNAFKYTKSGLVTLQICWEKMEAGAMLRFIISDTGQGIKEEDIKKLFSEYSQLDTHANRKIEGTGLGLSITKKLVEMMDGSIEVQSEYGWGSTFIARVFQKIAEERPIGPEVAENLKSFRFIENRRSRTKNLIRAQMPYGKVLVVDDVLTNLDVAKGLMLPYGLTIDCVLSGQEAIDAVRSEKVRYNAIFMDHMMPGMDGIEATRIIRNEIGTKYARTVPIIALTANALMGNEEMFLTSGFNAFIAKPIDIMRLDTLLNQWVRNKETRETLWKADPGQDGGAAQAAASLGMTRVEEVDIKAGVERYGEEKIYLNILRSYITHSPGLLEKLRALSPETLADYAITVHGLKGASYGICADGIGREAEELEQAARAGDYERVAADTGGFILRVEQALEELGALVEQNTAGGPAKQNVSVPDRSLLGKLLDASKRFKPAVMEEVLAELEKYEYETGGDLISWLREQLDNLEYDAIRERLEQAIESIPV